MAYLNTQLISHTRRVCSLYKRALRNAQSCHHDRLVYRYEAVLLRHRFDQNRDIDDFRKAKQLLIDGEEELFQGMHYQPLVPFTNSPGGIAYERYQQAPDWVLDYWHPLEKAQYPKYFAKREQRKKEYVEFWEKQHGKYESTDHH